MEEDLILSKAELISGGAVRLPKGYRPPVRFSRSTAGPGAGNRSLVFSFSGMRVKKAISDDGEFFYDPSEMTITKEGRVVAEDVSIMSAEFHCPEQAFFNLDQRCRFNCLFCSSPVLGNDATKGLTDERIIELIKGSKEPVLSIALTTGVPDSVDNSVDRMARCVSKLKAAFPEMIIGVEPYVDDASQIEKLHDAGASEIKINVETATDGLFEEFCPMLDRENIFNMLAHAVEVFGRGKVSSNLIIGLGESDDDAAAMMERLCLIGVTPTVRGLRIDVHREKILSEHGILKGPSSERLMRVAEIQKGLMKKYSLDPNTFETMCLRCRCCDLVPFIDL